MITPLSEALAERGFDTLTPVQTAVTASDVGEADLLVSAQTGSGKTVGFGLAIAPTLLGEADRFGPAGTPLALVVAPTRELAFQVMQELRWLYEKTGAIVNACVGGMDARQERRLLERGTHIVVGTPGRLCDHIRRGALDLSDCRAVVLDEADEMLDLGFREDLEFILSSAPAERRTLMFSATVSPVIAKLAEQFQKDAHRVNTIDKAQQHSDISYQALRVADRDVDHAIYNMLRFHDDQSAIVFANTRATVNHLTTRLANRGLPVVSLSGELSQSERSHALQAMRDGRARICVATDVAARGIDLPNLNLVIHAELPTNTESLLHRSGRTGRAGRKGISAIIVPPKMVRRTERLLQWAKLSADWAVPPSAEDIRQRDEDRLLNDPAWAEPLTAEQTAFAEKVLARYTPETVAAAVLRLHEARHAAPEDLDSPDTPAPRREAREPRDFGPSKWFSLSVGRANKAEARWLLPLILRAADLEKTAIGAIRVQDSETYVEIAEAHAGAFEAALGPDGALEDGVHARVMDKAPEQAPRAPKPPYKGDKPSGPRGGGKPYGAGKPSGGKPYGQGKPAGGGKPYGKGKPFDGDKQQARPRPRPEAADAAPGSAPAPRPASDSKPKYAGKPAAGGSKPYAKDKPSGGAKPYAKDKPKSAGTPYSKEKPYSKDKPAGAGKPYAKGKPDGAKRFDKSDKPRGAAGEDKPKGPKKARPGFNPNDPSASGKPRGGKRPGKPGAPSKGGNAMPKRPPKR